MSEPVVDPGVAQAAAQTIAQQAPIVPAAQPVAQPAPAVAPAAPATVVAPATDASDRTKEQFEKLLESNQRLYDANENLSRELARKAQAAQTFQPIQQPTAVAPQIPRAQDFVEVNPVTGEQYVNTEKLNAAMESVTQRATRAEQAVNNYIQTSEQREIDRENTEAFGAHPELNPKTDKFDAQFSDFTRAVIYDSFLNESRYGGKPLTFKEAADLVKSKIKNNEAPVAPQPVVAQNAQVSVAQDAKVQGSLAATGTPQRAPDNVQDLETLREMTRRGGPASDQAIAARLKNIDHIIKASEEGA